MKMLWISITPSPRIQSRTKVIQESREISPSPWEFGRTRSTIRAAKDTKGSERINQPISPAPTVRPDRGRSNGSLVETDLEVGLLTFCVSRNGWGRAQVRLVEVRLGDRR